MLFVAFKTCVDKKLFCKTKSRMEEKEDKYGKDKLEEFIYWNTFGVEKWYHQLIGATEEEGHRPCTFRSSFLAISIEEAQAFMEYQELLLEHLDDEVPPPIEHPLLVKVYV